MPWRSGRPGRRPGRSRPASSRLLLAKPHAPSTRTRIPKPSLSPAATPSTRPDLTAIDSSTCWTIRTSAYAAPRTAAVDRARSVRSRIVRHDSRTGDHPARLERRAAADRLAGEPDPEREDEAGRPERDVRREPAEARAPPAVDGPCSRAKTRHQADATEDERHPQAEGDDEDQAVGRAVDVDRGEQDDQGVRRRDQAAGQARGRTGSASRSARSAASPSRPGGAGRTRRARGAWTCSARSCGHRARRAAEVEPELAEQQPAADRDRRSTPETTGATRVEQLRREVPGLEDERRQDDDPEGVRDGHGQAQGDRVEGRARASRRGRRPSRSCRGPASGRGRRRAGRPQPARRG